MEDDWDSPDLEAFGGELRQPQRSEVKRRPSKSMKVSTFNELGPNQKKYIEALRSGQFLRNYENYMSVHDRYDPLGVACELFRYDLKLLKRTFKIKDLYGFELEIASYSNRTDMMPEVVKAHLAFRTVLGGNISIPEFPHLAKLHKDGKSFEEIADILESVEGMNLYFYQPK